MGLLKNRVLSKSKPLVVSGGSDYENHDDQPETDDDIEIIDRPWPPDVGHTPPKRRVQQDTAISEEDEGPDADSVTVSAQSLTKPSTKASKRDTVRMSTDIDAELHTRLRLHSIKTKQTLIAIIEQWIVKHCPE